MEFQIEWLGFRAHFTHKHIFICTNREKEQNEWPGITIVDDCFDFKLKCKTGPTVKDRRIDVFWGESRVANVSLKSSYYVDLI